MSGWPWSSSLTSRPSAIDDTVREQLAELHFEGRRLAELSPEKIHDLGKKMLRRLEVHPEGSDAVLRILLSRECQALARVPITMGLLIHVLVQRMQGPKAAAES